MHVLHVPRVSMRVQAEPKKEKKQKTMSAAEKSLAAQNKEVLADSGAQVRRPARGGGGSARVWASSACSGVRVPCALGRRGSQGAGEGRARGGQGREPPFLCSRQAKKRLSFLLGQSELFKHFGLKEVHRAPRTRSPSAPSGPSRPQARAPTPSQCSRP